MPYWCWHLPRYAISRFGMGGKHFRHTIPDDPHNCADRGRDLDPDLLCVIIPMPRLRSSTCESYISLFDTWWCTFLFVFILNWAEFLLARMLTHPEVTTLTVLLNNFQSAAEGRLTIDFPGCRPGPSHPEAPGQRLQLRHYPQVT